MEGLSEDLGSSIPSEFRPLLKEMDIPAIGQDQLETVNNFLKDTEGNCAVLLGHHNPLPTHQLVIRPYAGLVDAGQLIFEMINTEKRIIFLHGHTHCDTTLIANCPEILYSGFIACLGANGLHRLPWGGVPSAAFIKLLADENGNFLAAIVSRFQMNGVSFMKTQNFPIYDDTARNFRSTIAFDNLDPEVSYTFDQVFERLNLSDKQKLKVELLKRRSLRQIKIADVDRSEEDWRITRNA